MMTERIVKKNKKIIGIIKDSSEFPVTLEIKKTETVSKKQK